MAVCYELEMKKHRVLNHTFLISRLFHVNLKKKMKFQNFCNIFVVENMKKSVFIK